MPTKPRISEQLREAIRRSGKTRYRISLETGISESILSRFVNRGAGLSLANIDVLCECIGVRLMWDAPKERVERRATAKRKGR